MRLPEHAPVELVLEASHRVRLGALDVADGDAGPGLDGRGDAARVHVGRDERVVSDGEREGVVRDANVDLSLASLVFGCGGERLARTEQALESLALRIPASGELGPL